MKVAELNVNRIKKEAKERGIYLFLSDEAIDYIADEIARNADADDEVEVSSFSDYEEETVEECYADNCHLIDDCTDEEGNIDEEMLVDELQELYGYAEATPNGIVYKVA